jgi:hypothetical protein
LLGYQKSNSSPPSQPSTHELGMAPEAHHVPHELPPQPSGLKVEKPNFVIFMPDQLRYDSLGCSGNKVWRSPISPAYLLLSVSLHPRH